MEHCEPSTLHETNEIIKNNKNKNKHYFKTLVI